MIDVKKEMNSIFLLLLASILSLSCTTEQESQTKNQVKKILILGNSIVEHPASPAIGWNHDWGMAASAKDSDFVHRLEVLIHTVNPSIQVDWKSISAFERNYDNYDLSELSGYRDFDMIILKISENVKHAQGMEKSFLNHYNLLVNYLNPNGSSVVIISEGFWPTPVNEIIKRYAQKKDFPFIRLSDLFSDDESNSAKGMFEHEGVSNHPSDKGMRNIATRIWEVVKAYL